MKLKPRTTYVNGFGMLVRIAGRTRRADELPAFWSIGGDHYAEDGRMIWGRATDQGWASYALPEGSMRNLVEEVDTAAERLWWKPVETEGKT